MILTRSPYYVKVDFGSFVNYVDFNVRIGRGNIEAIGTIQSYSIRKYPPSDTTTKTWLDISPFPRDFYEIKPVSTKGITAPTVIEGNEVVLVKVETTVTDSLENTKPTNTQTLMASDGFGYYDEGQNPNFNKKILLSNDEYKAFENGYFIVPLMCDSNSSDPLINGISYPLNFVDTASNYTKYLIVPLVNYLGGVKVDFEGETIFIELIEECKYPVTPIQFLNRFGAIEQVDFYKSEVETISIQSKTFKNAYTDGSSYDTTKHQNKQYNKTSSKSRKIETGYLNEEYNVTMQQLMESEYTWINGKPVNIASNSLEFKTKIVDKLISYSVNFKHAYDEINNV